MRNHHGICDVQKTSTSHAYKTERKGYWQLFYTCDNSTEYY